MTEGDYTLLIEAEWLVALASAQVAIEELCVLIAQLPPVKEIQ
jgi:hypothetical protein